ncbi:MAG: transporter [Afipia sp. 62-7]|nr:TolC family outer membrane protein [Afipia sp.]OJU20557.1 MAG: transporter [Afipia sp. 62-7]
MARRASGFGGVGWRSGVSVAAMLWAGLASPSQAETLNEALVRAYQSNPQLNASRAQQRATDENVPQALAGYRPQIIASLSTGLQPVRNLLPDNTIQTSTLKPWTIGVTVTQNLFNGFKTSNSVRVAEFQVLSGREALRNTGQGVLLDAVTAYMNVIANQALVEAQRSNVTFLRETLGITKKRLDAGDVTPTDTAQADARLSRGLADLNAAEVALETSRAVYAQVIGNLPVNLTPAQTVDRFVPRTRQEAVDTSQRENPAVTAATYDVDVATTTINVAESSLMPQLDVQGNVNRSVQTDTTLGTTRTDSASVVGALTVPIYDGGTAASQTRQAKETAVQSRLVLEQVRNQARTAAVSAWISSEGTKVALAAAEAEVKSANIALQGVRREAQAGQRTTIDVLNSQQDLTAARSRQILAQRDRVIASYTLLSAIGRLDVRTLGLNTPDYLPEVHYHQVRDAWHGVRTPSGR